MLVQSRVLLTATAASAQKVVTVGSRKLFVATDAVTLKGRGEGPETGVVDSVSDLGTVTLVGELANAYTTANEAYIGLTTPRLSGADAPKEVVVGRGSEAIPVEAARLPAVALTEWVCEQAEDRGTNVDIVQSWGVRVVYARRIQEADETGMELATATGALWNLLHEDNKLNGQAIHMQATTFDLNPVENEELEDRGIEGVEAAACDLRAEVWQRWTP